jgi:ribonuclease HI
VDVPGEAGAIARDDKSKVIIAACAPISRCRSVEEAKAKAALMGIKVLSGLGATLVILELDPALKSTEPNRSLCWATINEIKKLLRDAYIYRINHAKRESNRAADGLANLARSACSCIWTSALPNPIWDIVTQDISVCVNHAI